MSGLYQCLLRLPAGLRRQAFQDASLRSHTSLRLDSNRTYSITARLLRQPPVKPAPRSIKSVVSKPSARPSPPRQTVPNAAYKPITYADTLLKTADSVLLYKSPRHRSFTIIAWLFGSVFLIGAYSWSQIIASRPLDVQYTGWRKWAFNASAWGTALFFSVMGTVLILAPTRMIRSVVLVRAAAGGSGEALLRCEKGASFPSGKSKFVELRPSDAMLDRRVSAVDIDLTSVPLSQAEEFTATAAQQPDAQLPRSAPRVGVWGTLFMDVRRIFFRDGLAYVRFENHGTWKMDLQHCELLDDGRPLERLTSVDLDPGTGPVAWVRRNWVLISSIFSSK